MLFATLTIRVSTKGDFETTIEDEDEINAAFYKAEQTVLNSIDTSKFEVASDA